MTTPGAAGEVVITSTAKAMADEMVRELPRAARSVEEFETRITAAGGMDRFAEQISASLSQLTRVTQEELRKQEELRANAARQFRSTGRLDVPGGQSFSAVGKTELGGLGTGITVYAQAIEKAYGPAAARLVEAEGAKAMRAALQTQLNLTKNLEAVQKVTNAPARNLVGSFDVVAPIAAAEKRLREIGRSAEEIAALPVLPRISPRTGKDITPAIPRASSATSSGDDGAEEVRYSRAELAQKTRDEAEKAARATAAQEVADRKLEQETLRLAEERLTARTEAARKRGVKVAGDIPLTEATRLVDNKMAGRVGTGGNAPFAIPGYDRQFFDVVRPQPTEANPFPPAPYVTPIDDRARQQQLELQRTSQEKYTAAQVAAYRQEEADTQRVLAAERQLTQLQLKAIAEDEARTRVRNAQALDRRLATQLQTPRADDPSRMQATQIGGPSSNLYRTLEGDYAKRTAIGAELVQGDTNLLSATRRYTEQITRQEQSGRGFFSGVLSGATSRGLNSTAGGTGGLSDLLDGDNRKRILGNLGSTAGNAIRYSAAYATLGIGTGVIASEAAAIRDYTDSLTDLQVAFGETNKVSQEFIGQLGEIARISGSNVAEAMDSAARGVRAFGDETKAGDEAAGQAVAKVSAQLALITGGKLVDKTGDLIASASAYNVAPRNQSQILDAVAYAKRFSGDPNQISQGLANFGSVGASAGFNSLQSASLISLVSGRSDETGQAAATRLSKVLATIHGQAGRSTLSSLGIDVSGTPAEVLEKAIDAYGRLSKAQQQQLLIAVGGNAQQRETTALFSQGGEVLRQTADATVALGAGEDEAKRRGGDLVGLLKALSADIKGIETGLGATDIFAPIVISLRLLEPALHALDSFINLLNQFDDVLTKVLPLPSFLPANLITGLAFDALIIRKIFKSIRADRDASLAGDAAAGPGLLGRTRARVGTAIGGAGVQRATATAGVAEADAAATSAGAGAAATAKTETTADTELAAARDIRATATLAAAAADTDLAVASDTAAGATGRLATLTANLARLDREVSVASLGYGRALAAQDALLADATASTEALAAAEANVLAADNALVRANALYTAGLEELAYAQNAVLDATTAQAAAETEAGAAAGRATVAVEAETVALAAQNVEREAAAAIAAKLAAAEARRTARGRISAASDADYAATQRLVAAQQAERATAAGLAPFVERVNAAHLQSAQAHTAAARAAIVQEKAEMSLAASQAAVAASSREVAAGQADLAAAGAAQAAAATRVQRAGFQGQAFAAVAAGYTPASGRDEAKLQRALAAETDLQVAQQAGTAAEARIAAAEEARTAALARVTTASEALTVATTTATAATEAATVAQAEYDATLAASHLEGMAAADRAAAAAKAELTAATQAAAVAQTELNAAQASAGAANLVNSLGPLGVRRAGSLGPRAGLSNEAASALRGDFAPGASQEFKDAVNGQRAASDARKAAYLAELKERNLGTLSLKQAFQRSSGIVDLGGARTGSALARLGDNIALGARGLASTISKFLTSGLGMSLLGIGGALAAVATYRAGTGILKASDAANDAAQNSKVTSTDVTDIRKQAADARTAAQNARKSSGGPIGSTVNAIYGDPSGSASRAADKTATAFEKLANDTEEIRKKNAVDPLGDPSAAIDVNSSTGVADGLKLLAESGRNAQVQFDALIKSFDKLGTAAEGANTRLSASDQLIFNDALGTNIAQTVAGGVALTGNDGTFTKLRDNIGGGILRAFGGHPQMGHNREDQDALKKVDTAALTKDIEDGAAAIGDTSSPEGKAALEKLVRFKMNQYLPILNDKGLRQQLINDAVGDITSTRDAVGGTNSALSLSQLLAASPGAADAAAARAGQQAAMGVGPKDPTDPKRMLSTGMAQAQASYDDYNKTFNTAKDVLQAQEDEKVDPKHPGAGKIVTDDDPRLEQFKDNRDKAKVTLDQAALKDIDNKAKLADALATPFDESGALARRQAVLDQKSKVAVNQDDKDQIAADQATLNRDKVTQALKAQQSARVAALDPRDTAGLANAKQVGDQANLDRITSELKAAGVAEKDYINSDAYNQAVATLNQDHIDTLQTALDKETAIALASLDSRDQLGNLTTQIDALTKKGGQLDIDKGDPVALAKDGQHKDDLNRQLEQYKKERVDATNALKIDPGDLLGNDQQSINEAQTALDGALQFDKDGQVSLDYQKKQKALDNAKLKLAQDQVSAGDAQARALIPAGDDVASATQDVADAQHALDKLTKGNADFAAAQRTLADKQRDLAQAQLTRSEAIVTEGIDRTDPVKVAKNNLSIAQQQLEFDKKHGAGEDKLRTDRISVKDLSNAAEDAQFQQNLSDAQTKERLQQSTHAQYLQYLKSEHDRLTAIKDKTRQQQDELNQIDGLIKDANSSLAGQFNLGDIKLPSVYEVRRSLKQDAIAGNASAANSTVVNNVISINGADTAEVKRVITGLLGPSAIRRTPTAAGAKL